MSEYQKFASDKNGTPSFVMPDGSGPWTVVALKLVDEPGARYGYRGIRRSVEVRDNPHHRLESYHTIEEAAKAAKSLNDALESFKSEGRIDTDARNEHGRVGFYDIALHHDAQPNQTHNHETDTLNT
jgi:hypothetical protein